MSAQKLLADLKKKIYAPVYFLHGEESYFTDVVVDYIESKVLSDADKEFNQTILYGKDIDVPTMISYAKRYPMMASHQVVIVKEAQEIKNLIPKDKERDLLLEYLEKPTPTTLLVLAYKHKSLDKRTKLYKALSKHAITLESKKLYDNEIPDWISSYFLSKSGRINREAAVRMGQYLGNDLTKIANEDMHNGNLSFFLADDFSLSLAPIYDMLPMRFAPTIHGEVVEREIKIPPATVLTQDVWSEVCSWAKYYWQQVAVDERISTEFKAIAEQYSRMMG